MASIGTFTATFLASVDGLIKPIKEATGSLTTFQKTLKSAQTDVINFGKKAEVIGAPLQALGVLALGASADIKKAMNEIRVGTGATGPALEELKKNFADVFGETPKSAREVGEAIALLNTRLGLTGKPLTELTNDLLGLAEVTETEVKPLIESTAKAFQAFKVPVDEQGKSLEFLLHVFQNTGVGVQRIEDQLVSSGASLRNLGFNFEQAAVLVAKFDKEGIDATGVVRSLNRAFASMAKQGIEPGQQAFNLLIETIKNTKDPVKQAQEAIAVFGNRAGPVMADAIRSGRFEIDELTKRIKASTDTIKQAKADTQTFSDEMVELRHQVEIALGPLGATLRKTFTDTVIPLMKEGAGVVMKLSQEFQNLSPVAQKSIFGVAAAIALLGPGLITLGGLLFSIREIITAFKFLAGLSVFKGFLDIASLFQGAKSLGDIALAFKVIGGSAAGLTAVSGAVVLIGAAIGTVVGLTVNWILKVTGLQESFDKLFISIIRNVPIVGNALADWVKDTKGAKDAADSAARTNELFQKRLTELGISFDVTKFKNADYVNSLIAQVAAHDRAQKSAAGTTKTTKSLGEQLGLTGQALIDFNNLFNPGAADKFKKALESIREKVAGDTTEMRALDQVIREFTASGVPAQVVIERLGKSAGEAATNWTNLGKAIPEATRSLALATIFFENFKKLNDELIVNQLNLQKVLVDGGAVFIKTLTDQSKALQKQLDDITNYNIVLQRIREQNEKGIGAGSPLLTAPIAVPPATFGITRVPKEIAEQGIDAARELGIQAQQTAAKIDKMKSAGMNLDQIVAVLGPDIEQAANTVKIFGDKVDEGAKKLIEFAHAQQVGKDFVDSIVNDISKIFTDSIAHGKKFWEAFAALGKDALAGVADFFIKDLLHAVLDPLRAAFGQLINSIKSALDSVIKNIRISIGGLPIGGAALGAGIGGAALATRGTGGAGTILAGAGGFAAGAIGQTLVGAGAASVALGGSFFGGIGALVAATGPLIPIAAAAAGALILFGHAIGNAHKKANEFVQNFQNPFGDAFLSIADANNKLYGAGQQTYEGAVAAQQQVAQLWDTFVKQSADFAKKGKDQAKVVAQAFAVIQPQVTGFFQAVKDEIEALKPGALKLVESVFKVDQFNAARDQIAAANQSILAQMDQLMQEMNGLSDTINQVAAIDFTGESLNSLYTQQQLLWQQYNALASQLQDETVPAVYTFAQAIQQTADAVNKNDVQAFVDKVFASVTGAGSLNEALRILKEAGTPTSVIIRELGTDINNFASSLEAMGLPIPDLIAQFRTFSDTATKTADAAQKPIATLETIRRIAALTKTALGAGDLRGSLLGDIAGVTRSLQLGNVPAQYTELPALQEGGILTRTGALIGHASEIVMPMKKLARWVNDRAAEFASYAMPNVGPVAAAAGAGGVNNYELNVSVESKDDLEDPDVFDRKIARPFVRLISRGNRGHRTALNKAFKEANTTRR